MTTQRTKSWADDYELTFAARLLSTEHGDVVGRHEAERAMAGSAQAPWLYEVRRAQCAVTVKRSLDDGTIPTADLWVPWRRVCAAAQRDHEAAFADWRDVEESLADAAFSIGTWRGAVEAFHRLLPVPDEERQELIRDENGEHCDYLLACVCLAVETRNRDTGDLVATRMAVGIAENLLEKYRRSLLADEATPDKLVPSILTDLLVLAWARLANVHRILGELAEAHRALRNALVLNEEVELSPYVEAELASLHASLLKDEGLDLDLAEQRIRHAVEVFASFDPHEAARARIKLAAIQRLQGNDAYVATLRQAIDGLDAHRAPGLVEAARNNLFLYLVKENRLTEALDLRHELPRPADAAHRASRLCAEGYLDVKLKNLDSAQRLLSNSAERFTGLHRLGDAMIALLFLAAVRALKDDRRETRDHLATARHFARSCGYSVADAIDRLLDETAAADDLASQILDVASQAEECLGRRRPAEVAV